MSPGNASSTVVRCWPNTACAYLVANGRPVAAWVSTMPRSNRPEQIRTNAIRSRWARSMPACTLNTRPEVGASSGRGLPSASSRGSGAGARSTSASSSRATPTPVSAAPNSTGVALPARKSFSSNSAPISRQQRQLVLRRRPELRLGRGDLRLGHHLGVRPGGAARGAGEPGELPGRALDQPAQLARDPDRPGDRHRPQPDRLLHLVEQLEGLPAGPVPLVDERDHRDPARAADVEQLERLRLQALRGVEQHHRGVDGGEHPVGVLGEVAVAGGVQQVDHAVAVAELQHRGGDGDAALALHLHPVGRDAPPARLAVHGTRRVDHLGVQRERLGERGLAGVRVADHGERAAPARLRRYPDRLNEDLCHEASSLSAGRGRPLTHQLWRSHTNCSWCAGDEAHSRELTAAHHAHA